MRGNKATGPSSRLCGMIMRSFICWDKSVPEAQAKGSFLASIPSHSLPWLPPSLSLSSSAPPCSPGIPSWTVQPPIATLLT